MTEDVLAMRASWIAAPQTLARSAAAGSPLGTATGSWLLRRDVDLAGHLLVDRETGEDLTLCGAELLVASTGDVRAYVDEELVADVRALGPGIAELARADLGELLLGPHGRADHLSLALAHVEDGSTGAAGGPGRVPPSVIGALVLTAQTPAGQERQIVVGTDTSWWTAPGPIRFAPRTEPGRRMLELHGPTADAPGEAESAEADPEDWLAFGIMHADRTRQWQRAVDRGRHPSLVHPQLVEAPQLVAEELVAVREVVLAPGGVQCLDLGAPVRSRPELALPDGARRPVTLWGGMVPGTPPCGGDLQIRTGGQAAVLEAHGTCAGRYLHIHGSPDLEVTDIAVPVRTGILPRPLGIELSDDVLARMLGDAFASLAMRCQEQYRGDDDIPLLGQIAVTARAALLTGHDTWRSERSLRAFCDTARSDGSGTVVDAVAPGGPHADLDEHTFSLPTWILAHRALAPLDRRFETVLTGITQRLLARARTGAPAERMDTLAAALGAFDALIAQRSRDTSTGALPPVSVSARAGSDSLTQARDALRARGREVLRAPREARSQGAWLAQRRTGSSEDTSTARAAAQALLCGLVTEQERPATTATLLSALTADPSAARTDPRGLLRAALLRAGSGRQVVDAHRGGDDVPPLVLLELIGALSGLELDGDRLHVRTPTLALRGVELRLPHRRGDVTIRWEGTSGTISAPRGTSVLVHRPEGGAPLWYNSGTTALTRPAPTA